MKLALRDVNKRFDMEWLDKIRNQFLLFSERFVQTWNHIPFVYVHLKSAYATLKTDDQEKSRRIFMQDFTYRRKCTFCNSSCSI